MLNDSFDSTDLLVSVSSSWGIDVMSTHGQGVAASTRRATVTSSHDPISLCIKRIRYSSAYYAKVNKTGVINTDPQSRQ